MIKPYRLLVIIFVIFSLTACSESNLSIMADPWWQSAYDVENEIKKIVFFQSLYTRKKINNNTFQNREELVSEINSLLLNEEAQRFIITPYLFSQIKNNYENEKKINYIILNGFYSNPADNVIAVYSSREEVYFQAGIKAAQFSKENDNCTVAAVFYNGTTIRRLENESFLNGFDSVSDAGELIYYEQSSYTGGEKLKSFINSAPDKDTGLFFLSASSVNPYCLDLILPLSISISGENLNSSGFYNELVEFSVDDDIIEIIQTAVEIGLDGEIFDDIPVKPLIKEKGIHF